jgi:hypothetical protein
MNQVQEELAKLKEELKKYPEKKSIIEFQEKVLKSELFTKKRPTLIELQKKYLK